MVKYVIKRLLMLILVVLGVTVLIFSLMHFVPGDPATLILGSTADLEDIEALRESMGLNDPFIVQLGRYMYNVFLKFDFGSSYYSGKTVTSELITRMPYTLILGFSSIILTLIIGVPLGILAAVKHNRPMDYISMIIALIGVSMPGFWIGLLLVIVFALNLGILPATGVDTWTGYILPVIATSLGALGGLARQSRSSMLEVINSDYNVTARAKGLSEREIIVKHALPNALLPIITIAGSQLSNIFGGSVVIETVFSIPGVGMYMVQAISSRDYPAVEGAVIILSIIFSIIMLLVDLAYAFIDPRIKETFAGKR